MSNYNKYEHGLSIHPVLPIRTYRSSTLGNFGVRQIPGEPLVC